MTLALCGVTTAEETNEVPLPVGPTRLSMRPGLGMTPRFQEMDTNGDGKISFEEFSRFNVARYTPRLFAQLDVDSSDTLEIAEIASQSDQDFLRMLDTDADGLITRKEFMAVADKLQEAFDKFDTNHDGFLTPDELTVLNRRFGKRRQRDVTVQ
jgi:hypothetical protein